MGAVRTRLLGFPRQHNTQGTAYNILLYMTGGMLVGASMRGTFLFDSSALVDIFADDSGVEAWQSLFAQITSKFTTLLSFYDALIGMKERWAIRRDPLEDYLSAARRLTTWYGALPA